MAFGRASRFPAVFFGRCATILGPPLALHAAATAGSATTARCSGVGPETPSSTCLADGSERVRLVQYNVRGLTAEDGTSTVDAVAQTLQALNPAIVCLNEVDLRKQPAGLEQLSKILGTEHVHFFGHVRGTYGNAILSRYPLTATRDVHVEGGSQLEHPKGSGQIYRIGRGMAVATLQLPGRTFTIASLHLDHMSEDERVVQMSHVLREASSFGGNPHIIVGDLNALLRDDYSAAEWASAEAKAVRNGWVPPCDARSIRLLLDAGYIDATPGAGQFTAHVSEPMYRIDYALLSRCATAAGLQVASSFVDTSATGSDHFPLVVDLEWAASSAGPEARL